MDGAVPGDLVAPVDGAVPGDLVAPVDGAVPGDLVAPVDSTVPRDLTAPVDLSAPRDLVAPVDGSNVTPDLGGVCQPQCAGRVCGSDGCGGSCGSCTQDKLCSAAGSCVAIASGGDPIQVDVGAVNGAISPEIYGLASADAATLNALRIPLHRWGGNRSTRYNWQLDVSNTGNDYFFENIANNPSDTSYGTPSYVSASDAFVETSRQAQAAALVTIPTIGWTPKDRVTRHPFTCGYPVSRYGAQRSVDPYDTNCGNGVTTGGANITGDPTTTSAAAPPSFEAAWVSHLVNRFGAANASGVRFYQLDNEMTLWDSTHRDVHPASVGTDEVWQKTLDYAPVIRAADPTASILGFGTWGVLDVFISGTDRVNNNRNDQLAHGGLPLLQWYLRQLASYERTNGKRLVDCLDLHYYPQGGDPLQNTRSLWDPGYRDPSWVDSFLGEPVQLFPRIRGWVASEYPGTGICVSEYNFNLYDQTNPLAALVEADVLGIFGKYGVRLAAYWTTPVDGQGAPLPAWYAFRLYRNYDGAGGSFGGVSVSAATSLTDVVVYAATDPASGLVTVVLVNKRTTQVDTTLRLLNFTPGASARSYGYVAQAGAQITRGADVAAGSGRLTLRLPASSMTLLAIPKG
ncbi:MAG TPA: glycoside hydrolase family 44 protein [Polyangia bacterium]|nr:glycoside hydrolase family 44 protein [Polyangia bacterium]